jgi:hypothetical protein
METDVVSTLHFWKNHLFVAEVPHDGSNNKLTPILTELFLMTREGHMFQRTSSLSSSLELVGEEPGHFAFLLFIDISVSRYRGGEMGTRLLLDGVDGDGFPLSADDQR